MKIKSSFALFLALFLFLGVSFTASATNPPTGDYKKILDRFTALQNAHPKFSQLFSIGENDDGVAIMALRISTSPDAADPKKIGQLIVATHHGNEKACPEFAHLFSEELLKKYESTELLRGNLADQEWTIIPVLNISGYNQNNRYEHGVDPNRDYPGVCNNLPGGKLKSIVRLMEHIKSRAYTGSLTVHGYVGSLTYPWGVDAEDLHTKDHNQFASVTAKAAALNDYEHGTSTDIVYSANNTYEDYAYWKHGMWSLLMEMRDGSKADLSSSTAAIFKYFELLDSSPSQQHQFTSQCTRTNRPDLRIE